jgi:hypothetical protein
MKIFILEDDPYRIDWFLNQLLPHRVCVCNTVIQAASVLSQNKTFDAIFLDHDLLPHHYDIYRDCQNNSQQPVPHIGRFDSETGMAVAKLLGDHTEVSSNAKIILHSQNQYQVPRMEQYLQARNNVTVIPFPQLKIKGLKQLL